jgi:hypothetical protein
VHWATSTLPLTVVTPKVKTGVKRREHNGHRVIGAGVAVEDKFAVHCARFLYNASPKRTGAPSAGFVNSPSHITRAPRTIVPIGQPVTCLPS